MIVEQAAHKQGLDILRTDSKYLIEVMVHWTQTMARLPRFRGQPRPRVSRFLALNLDISAEYSSAASRRHEFDRREAQTGQRELQTRQACDCHALRVSLFSRSIDCISPHSRHVMAQNRHNITYRMTSPSCALLQRGANGTARQGLLMEVWRVRIC